RRGADAALDHRRWTLRGRDGEVPLEGALDPRERILPGLAPGEHVRLARIVDDGEILPVLYAVPDDGVHLGEVNPLVLGPHQVQERLAQTVNEVARRGVVPHVRVVLSLRPVEAGDAVPGAPRVLLLAPALILLPVPHTGDVDAEGKGVRILG